ncbi:hypothetical protein AC1031_003231 [Aphanomyces cochlioides]|nr:hypothetical protein AC1031_003231 [Aphanomyces cochlioides]
MGLDPPRGPNTSQHSPVLDPKEDGGFEGGMTSNCHNLGLELVGKECPKTVYQWSGEDDVDFWTETPDASKLENPPYNEEDQDPSASPSEASSVYEEEDSKN